MFNLVPSAAVKSLKAIPRDSTSVFIEYRKPIELSINGQFIYFLNLDLMTWKSYLISVSVVNNVDIDPASEIIKILTLDGIIESIDLNRNIILCEK
ncbi:unnamed protein product [Rotaria sp. Silwood2]|nr:unnamed protein product [Rotaria sp. Silwood2]